MNLIIKYISVFGVAVLMLFACRKDGKCIKSTGKVVTEKRIISNAFNRVSLDHNINLFITYDTIVEITVEAGENLLNHIITEVDGNTLTIDNENKCNFLRSFKTPINVYLTCPDIRYLHYSGSGNITATNTLNYATFQIEIHDGSGSIDLDLNCDSVIFWEHTGPADFFIKGNTNYLYAYSAGNGWFYMKDLTAKDVQINNNGTGDIQTTVTNFALFELYNIGNIDYYGNPPTVIISADTGEGQIRKK
ncbi:MAG: hypothetical protein Kow0079_16240 [Vicingaceae bacterium]